MLLIETTKLYYLRVEQLIAYMQTVIRSTQLHFDNMMVLLWSWLHANYISNRLGEYNPHILFLHIKCLTGLQNLISTDLYILYDKSATAKYISVKHLNLTFVDHHKINYLQKDTHM